MAPGETSPRLVSRARRGLTYFTDAELEERVGILVAFSTRGGGASGAPWASLDLAGHTGDEPVVVDENRRRLLEATGFEPARLVTAEQVHGRRVTEVGQDDAGRGALLEHGPGPVPGTDALMTLVEDVPLLMMYADCVPVVLVSEKPRAVSVVHAGWRGALAGLPGIAAAALASRAGTVPAGLSAYVGPHICSRHYVVSPDLAGAFDERFASGSHSVSILTAPPRVDLGAAVRASLEEAGLLPERVVTLGMCTVEEPTLFYSFRAEGPTGRHGALGALRK